jgi:hypothetical protein
LITALPLPPGAAGQGGSLTESHADQTFFELQILEPEIASGLDTPFESDLVALDAWDAIAADGIGPCP